MPCDASTGTHAAAAPRPPLEPAKAITAGNGPCPAGRANNPHTPGSRTSVTVAPGASQRRSTATSAVRPAAFTLMLALTGDGMRLAEGAMTSPDHHSPNGSVPVYVPVRLASRAVSTIPARLARKVAVASRVVL